MIALRHMPLLALYLTCCGAPAEPAPEAIVEAPDPEGCGMVFSPVPELLEATESAAARWSAATGCDVEAGPNGVPLVALDEVILANGRQDSARAVFRAGPDGTLVLDRIEIRRDHPDPVRGLTHEMGHALGGHGHSATGAMREGDKLGEPIDLASLLLVCRNLDCSLIRPER